MGKKKRILALGMIGLLIIGMVSLAFNKKAEAFSTQSGTIQNSATANASIVLNCPNITSIIDCTVDNGVIVSKTITGENVTVVCDNGTGSPNYTYHVTITYLTATASVDITATYAKLYEKDAQTYAFLPNQKTNSSFNLDRADVGSGDYPNTFKIEVSGTGWGTETPVLTIYKDIKVFTPMSTDNSTFAIFDITDVTVGKTAKYTIVATCNGMTQTMSVTVSYINVNTTSQAHWDRASYVVTKIDNRDITGSTLTNSGKMESRTVAERTVNAPQGVRSPVGTTTLFGLVKDFGDTAKSTHDIKGYWNVDCWFDYAGDGTKTGQKTYALRNSLTPTAEYTVNQTDSGAFKSVNSFTGWSLNTRGSFKSIDPMITTFSGLAFGHLTESYTDTDGNVIQATTNPMVDYDPSIIYPYTANAPAISGYTLDHSILTDSNNASVKTTSASRTINFSGTNTSANIAWVYKKDVVGPTNQPPVPIIDLPATCVAGDTVRLSGARSYDTDGTIVSYTWSIQGSASDMEGKPTGAITFPSVGDFIVMLDITDDDGAMSTTSVRIKVTAKPPIARFTHGGTQKERYVVSFDGSSSLKGSFPIDWSKTTWSISAETGGTNTNADFDFTPTAAKQSVQGRFYKQGRYRVSINIYDTQGVSSSYAETIIIAPDLPPEPALSVPATVTRDPSNGNLFTSTVSNLTKTVDGDSHKDILFYCFDSDNDGVYPTEKWKYSADGTNFYDTGLTEAQLPQFDMKGKATGRPATWTLKTNAVGKLYFKIMASEPLPDEKLAPALRNNIEQGKASGNTPQDRINIAPVTDLKAGKFNNVDLVVATDYSGTSLSSLNTRLSSFVSECYAKQINVNLKVISSKKQAGRSLLSGTKGASFVGTSSAEVYPVAVWNGLTEYSDHSYNVSLTTRRDYPSNVTTVTNDVFPARVRQSVAFKEARLWLLENGDVYMLGTFSANNQGVYCASYIYTKAPIKILSGISNLTEPIGQYSYEQMVFALATNGQVYMMGAVPMGYGEDWENRCRWNFCSQTADYSGTGSMTGSQGITGYYNASVVNGLSNIVRLKETPLGLLARDSSGNWYGVGRMLGAYGLSTGFGMYVDNWAIWGGNPCCSSKTDWAHPVSVRRYDNVNTFTLIPNLSNMDKALGGLIDVGVGSAVTSSGDKYSFTMTEVGESDFYIPWHAVSNTFTYKKTGTVNLSDYNDPVIASYLATTYSTSYTLADFATKGVPIKDYLPYLPGGMTGQEVFYTVDGSTPITGPKIMGVAPAMSYREGINNNHAFVCVRDYSLLSSYYDPNYSYTTGRWGGRNGDRWIEYTAYGGYRFTYNYTMRSMVIPDEESVSQQLGMKAYSVDLKALLATTFRKNANRYIFYIEDGDSFIKEDKAYGLFAAENNCSVRLSCDSTLLDRAPIGADTTNLRQFLNATSKGKLYGKGALETMLADVANENAVPQTSNVLYLIAGEDNAEYVKSFIDYESDTQQSERFRYDHNPTYFENGNGVASFNGQWIGSLINKFDKLGECTVTYQGQDKVTNLVPFFDYNKWSANTNQLKIYVHRRPIASFVASGSLVSIEAAPVSYTSDAETVSQVPILMSGKSGIQSFGYNSNKSYGMAGEFFSSLPQEDGNTGSISASVSIPEGVEGGKISYWACGAGYISLDGVKQPIFSSGPWKYCEIPLSAGSHTLTFTNYIAAGERGWNSSAFYADNINVSYSAILSKGLSILDKSYDLDHRSLVGKGIQSREWKWKYQNQAVWNDGLPSNVIKTRPIYIWQRVQDLEGAWSLPAIELVDFDTIKSLPVAQYNILKNPIETSELLKLTDTSYPIKGSLNAWQWIIYKLDANGFISTKVQDRIYYSHNNGTGALAGYDGNVQTNYSAFGVGTYRIYLRVRDTQGYWSDGETDGSYDLNGCYYQDLVVRNSMMLLNFRVSMIRDLFLEGYYKDIAGPNKVYNDVDLNVNSMCIDKGTFTGMRGVKEGFEGLTKGYSFEFEIDSKGFNTSDAAVEFIPSFYTISEGGTRSAQPVEVYWKDSKNAFWKAGEGGHGQWKTVLLTAENRKITGEGTATWRGSYLVPASAFVVPLGTTEARAKVLYYENGYIKEDLIVDFQINGLMKGERKIDYNVSRWEVERMSPKKSYVVGDVIRYDWRSNCLHQIKARRIF